MNVNSYTSYEEPRTASRQNTPIKSFQNWKHSKGPVQKGIISDLNDIAENRSAGFNPSFKSTMSYAPQRVHNTSSTPHGEAFTFGDVIDVVNPLQHIPVVGTIYRRLTGDQLNPISGIIGGALYGGPVGAVAGTMNAVSKIQTGKDMGDYAMGLFSPSKEVTHDFAASSYGATSINTDKKSSQSRHFDGVTSLQLAAMPPKRL